MAITTSPTSASSELAKSSREFLFHILQAQHRKIGAAVFQHDLGFELPLVGQRDLHLIRAFDDVVVGDHEARCIDHHARAERALHLLRLIAGNAEAAEHRIVQQRITRHRLRCVDVHHRGLHALNDRRIGHPKLGLRPWNHTILRQCGAARTIEAKSAESARTES
jgi:hypothetical protein